MHVSLGAEKTKATLSVILKQLVFFRRRVGAIFFIPQEWFVTVCVWLVAGKDVSHFPL